MKRFAILLAMGLAFSMTYSGCGPGEGEDNPVNNSDGGNDHGHDHDGGDDHGHDHDHAHGPNYGVIYESEALGAHVEVFGKYGDDLVLFYFFESDNETPKMIQADKLTVKRKGDDSESFEVEAVDLKDGMASRFEIENAKVASSMKSMGVILEIPHADGPVTMDIAKDPHAH